MRSRRRPPSAAAARALPAELYGERTRLLGVVDRESVTDEDRPVDDTVFTWPHLVVRHVVVALGVATVVLSLGVAFIAPLRGLANPNLTPEPSKAPWYFSGLQELLSHFDPLVAGILIPAGIVLLLLVLPYIDRNPATEARNRKVAVLVFSTLLTAAVVLTVIGTFFRGPGWHFVAPWDHLVHRVVGAGDVAEPEAVPRQRLEGGLGPVDRRGRLHRLRGAPSAGERCGRRKLQPR